MSMLAKSVFCGSDVEHRSEPLAGCGIPVELRLAIDGFDDADIIWIGKGRHPTVSYP